MEPWYSDCTGLNQRCSEPSSSMSRSPAIDLPHTSQKIRTHSTITEKEAARKEAADKEVVEKEAVEKESAEKNATEKEDDDEEEDQSWPSRSSDDDGPIRFPRVKHCFKCPICHNYLYQYKNSLFFHNEYMMMDEFLKPDMVEQHRRLNRLIEAAICHP
jgi:hypothetical protein